MSRAQAETVIKNIIHEIVQECAGRGESVSETLVAFMVCCSQLIIVMLIISVSLSLSIVSVCDILTDLSLRPSLSVCVCLSGKCTVAKQLNGSGCH